MTSPTGDPAPRVPDYQLLRRIGRGSYGDVWLARGLTGLHRAIKIVWRDRFDDAEPFEREFKGLVEFAKLQFGESSDLGWLRIVHIGRNDDARFFYYVMDLADDAERGRAIEPESYVPLTFAELRARRGRVPARECLAHGLALARALALLHDRGLVHRDIKPSNVIIVNGAPALADIGLVAPAASARTFVGTEGYVPPDGPGTPSADVYALGKVLYEISTGLGRHQFPQLPAGLAGLADHAELLALNEIILRACDASPSRRPPDGAALLADFARLQVGGPAVRARPRWTGIAAASAAALLAVAGVVAWRTRAALPSPVTDTAARPAAASAHAVDLPQLPAEKSLVVLPLASRGDAATAAFADDVHEEIIGALGRLRDIRTIAVGSVRGLGTGRLAPGGFAQGVRGGYFLHGTVRRDGDRVQLEVALRRAHRNGPEWTRHYEFALRDLASNLSALANDLVRALRAPPPPPEFSAAVQRHLALEPGAYDLLARARRLAAAAGNAGQLAASSALAEQALKRAPLFGAAAELLAANSLAAVGLEHDPAARHRHAAAAHRWAEEARRLAPDGSADGALARYHIFVKPDYPRAITLAENAVRAAPGVARHHEILALAYARGGRFADAAAAAHQAVDLDPLATEHRHAQLHALCRLRRGIAWERARAAYRAVLGAEPPAELSAEQYYTLAGELPAGFRAFSESARGAWLWRMRKFDEIAAEGSAPGASTAGTTRRLLRRAEALRRLGSAEAVTLAADVLRFATGDAVPPTVPSHERDLLVARAQAILGQIEPALAALQRALDAVPAETRHADRWDVEAAGAEILALLGRTRESVALLTGLLRAPSGVTVPMLRVDPTWDTLRGDPSFEALLTEAQNHVEL